MTLRIDPIAPRPKHAVLSRSGTAYAVLELTHGVADGAHPAAEA
jgi:hypothetical protein